MKLATGCFALLLAAMCGCSRSEPPAAPIGDPAAAAAEAKRAAAAARAAKDSDAAGTAAALARAALGEAEKRFAAGGDANRVSPELANIRAVAGEAIVLAELAREEHAVAKATSGWKAGTYRTTRKVALKGTFTLLALATKYAAAKGYDSLSAEHKQAADIARVLAEDMQDANGQPDWRRISERVSAMGDSPPPQVGLMLGVGYLLSGRDELALIEADGLSAADANTPGEKQACVAMRAVCYRLHGCPRLAEQEMARPEMQGAQLGAEMQAGFHLLQAYMAGSNRDLKRADEEIMRATRVWPNNPIGMALTGEVMVAEGRYEKAAVTLEDLGVKAADPWLAGHVQKRARAIRDGKGQVEPLFHDATFLRELAAHYAADAAAKSPAGRKFKDYLDAASGFGKQCLKLLPEGK